LTSEELRNAGYPGNNGLRDQRCALNWIKTHISAFGGDRGNITLFGESAGEVSVLSQLYSKEPLFKRAIAMSGTPLLLKALDLPTTEVAYSAFMKDLELENASAEERIARLLTISAEELSAKTPMYFLLKPFFDNDIVPAMTTFKGITEASLPIAGREWCSELMIGDVQHDVPASILRKLNIC
jgi:carboxylesterase type B